MSGSLIQNGKVNKYSLLTRLEHWLFAITIVGLLVNGFMPFLNRFFEEALDIKGGFRFPEVGLQYHVPLGILLIVLCLLHILIHTVILPGKKEILTTHPKKDMRNSFHAFLYFFLLAKKPERGSGERYTGNQKIVYLAFVFSLGLSMFSGYYMHLNGMGMHGFMGDPIKLTHVFGSFMVFLVALWHFGIYVRRRDWAAIKGIFFTGKVPLWHVRKNNKIWYDQIMSEQSDDHKATPLAHTLVDVSGGALHPEAAEMMADEMKSRMSDEELEYIKKLA